MGKKFIRNSKWQRMPHADGRPVSMWWYRSTARPPFDDTPTSDSLAVIDMYLYQAARGRTLPENFRKHLLKCLQDLNRCDPGRERYWTIPAYELAHRINPKTLCKRMRELEKIAKGLFPSRAPTYGKDRGPITQNEKEEMRRDIFQEDIKAIAEKHKITPARVGQICRVEIALQRATRQAEVEAAPPADVEEAF
jgi:hypothetical protein